MDIGVALSGGVDSSHVLKRLSEGPWGVFAVFMDTGYSDPEPAKVVAEHLGVQLYILNVRERFEEVVRYFVDEHERGRTPNPCALCNLRLKFGFLREWVLRKGDVYATGHYVRKGRYLQRPIHEGKDQTYVMSVLPLSFFERVLFINGWYSKDEVRRWVDGWGIPYHRTESNDLCFLRGRPKNDFLIKRLGKRKGDMILEGKVVGHHDGSYLFSIGQRRGLGLKDNTARYVKEIKDDEVILGSKEDLYAKKFRVERLNLHMDKGKVFKAKVVVRNKMKPQPCTVRIEEDGAIVRMDERIWAVAPGQIAAFYDDEGRVIGGGWISS